MWMTDGLGVGNLGNPDCRRSLPNVNGCACDVQVAFGTAMFMNFMLLLFERESAKFQLALLVSCWVQCSSELLDCL